MTLVEKDATCDVIGVIKEVNELREYHYTHHTEAAEQTRFDNS